jgi:hypothetical protein
MNTNIKIVRRRRPLMTEPGEMYLGTIDVDGLTYAYASDPTLCGVYIAGRWFTMRWDTPTADRFHGDVAQMARNIVNIHKTE